MPDRPTSPASALSAMALLATARTAAEVRRSMLDRRAGRDPSGQEPEADVRADLATLVPDLRGLLLQLRLDLIVGDAGDDGAGLVRAFETRMGLSVLARDLHRLHQKLLSLYPDVSEEVVEAARQRQSESSRLLGLDGPGFPKLLRRTVDRALALLDDLAAALEASDR